MHVNHEAAQCRRPWRHTQPLRGEVRNHVSKWSVGVHLLLEHLHFLPQHFHFHEHVCEPWRETEHGVQDYKVRSQGMSEPPEPGDEGPNGCPRFDSGMCRSPRGA